MKDNFDDKLMELLEYHLEDLTFEEFLEHFDLSVFDVFKNMYNSGLIIDKELEPLWPA